MAQIEKSCRGCRFVSTGAETCPSCGSSDLTDQWSGFVIILDAEKSDLAKIIEAKMPGKYAIRIK